MKWMIIGLVAIGQTFNGYGAGGNLFPGARSAALGKASVAMPGIWSVFSNQAGMAWQDGWSAGLFAENRFLMKELSQEAIALCWSGKPGAFGLGLSYHGFHLYNEFNAGIAYAKKFGKRFSAGVRLNYFSIHIQEGYGTTGVISCDAGMIYKPDLAWTFGVHVSNPVPVRLTDQPAERLPLLFRLGAGYDLAGKVLILIEGEKGLEHPLVVRSGIEVKLARSVCGRVGVSSAPFMMSGGIGLAFGKMRLDIATGYQTALGFSPSVSIGYSFNRGRHEE